MEENNMKSKGANAEKRAATQASLLPNAGIDDYYLCIYPDVPERCIKGIVGFVGNDSNPDIKIRIEIDHDWMTEHNYVSIAFWTNEKKYHESVVVMTPRYFDEFRKNPWLEFDLWHEIGHYHTLHYFDTPFNKKGSANATRVKYWERDEVMPEERAADIFGLYYTSREFALKTLSYAIERRHNYTWEPRETTEGAIQEFIRRKRILREIDSDEKAREMLCQLCGKDNYLEI
jgi:hypothetical protein